MKKIQFLLLFGVLLFSYGSTMAEDTYCPYNQNDQSRQTIIDLDLDILANYKAFDGKTGNTGNINDKVIISGRVPSDIPVVKAGLTADYYISKTPTSSYGKQSHAIDAEGTKGMAMKGQLDGEQKSMITLNKGIVSTDVLNSLEMVMNLNSAKLPTGSQHGTMLIETSGYGWINKPDEGFSMAGVGAERTYSATVPSGGTVMLDANLDLKTTVAAQNYLGSVTGTGKRSDDLRFTTRENVPQTTEKFSITGQAGIDSLPDGYGNKYHVDFEFIKTPGGTK